MKLWIDTNILLDVLMNREPYVKDSKLIWKYCETEQAEGLVSALSIANLIYVMRKELDPSSVKQIINKIQLIFKIEDLTTRDLEKAVELQWKDFEDSLQSVSAERVHADFIITRNVRDFSKSTVMALTPSELLNRI